MAMICRDLDKFTERFPAVRDGDLMLCHAQGVAYSVDRRVTAAYDAAYFNKCAGYEDQAIAVAINAGRIALVNDHVGAGAEVLDVGIGSGEFIKKRPGTFGYDVNAEAEAWLRERGLWVEWRHMHAFRAFTFWDVIEHVPDPGEYFRFVLPGSWLFTCLPIFPDLASIRASRHYRPGEHLYYWTGPGFEYWMSLYGFALAARMDFEVTAGRDSIISFAFKRTQRG